MFTNRQFVWQCVIFLLTLLTASIHADAQTQKQQKGKASYYSRRIDGHRTSSGERLNNDSLVCAHRTQPFGTKLLVRNPANGKEVVVRVIDRGPYSRGRIIDLSYEAARRLGMLSAGVAMVEVSVYDDTAIPFKPKETNMVPELELEMNGNGNALNPVWQRKEKENKEKNGDSENAAHQNKPNMTDTEEATEDVAKKTVTTKKKTTASKRKATVKRKSARSKAKTTKRKRKK